MRTKKGFYKKCCECGKAFYLYPSEEKTRGRKRKFCSCVCSYLNRKGSPSILKGIPLTEKHKKKLKEAKRNEKERLWRKTGKYIGCFICGKRTYKEKNWFNKKIKPFCSRRCSSKHITSKRRETIKRLGLNAKGRKVSDKHKKILSELRKKDFKNKEYVLNIRNSLKFKEWVDYMKQRSPKEHPNWKGGISFEPYDKLFNEQFKESIRERDNNVCMLCGISKDKLKRKLDIHHINYNKLNSSRENCVSLCLSCHMKTNFKREFWICFFRFLLFIKYGYCFINKELVIH